MAMFTAFWRLFPASLFTILSTFLMVLWRSDPVLMAIGACAAGAAMSWLIITTVEVAKRLELNVRPAVGQMSAAQLAT